jgi:hypothetical protein
MNNLSIRKAIAAGRTLEKLGYTYQDGELWKPPLGANPSPLLIRIAQLQAEVEELRKDSARLDWIIDNASSAGGGNGFTLKVFIPVDCECVRTAIDTAIAKDTQLTALSEMVKLNQEMRLYEPNIEGEAT